MNKWEEDEHKQCSEKVRNYEWINYVRSETMNGYDQINENRSLSPWG